MKLYLTNGKVKGLIVVTLKKILIQCLRENYKNQNLKLMKFSIKYLLIGIKRSLEMDSFPEELFLVKRTKNYIFKPGVGNRKTRM